MMMLRSTLHNNFGQIYVLPLYVWNLLTYHVMKGHLHVLHQTGNSYLTPNVFEPDEAMFFLS